MLKAIVSLSFNLTNYATWRAMKVKIASNGINIPFKPNDHRNIFNDN